MFNNNNILRFLSESVEVLEQSTTQQKLTLYGLENCSILSSIQWVIMMSLTTFFYLSDLSHQSCKVSSQLDMQTEI